jgi:hypothetical protein
MSEIRLRAIAQIGKISRELEKNERARTDLHPTSEKQTKAQQLAEAGISTSTANRYEQLAAPEELGIVTDCGKKESLFGAESREGGPVLANPRPLCHIDPSA